LTVSEYTPDLELLLVELFCHLDDHPARLRRGRGAPKRTSDDALVCIAVAQVLLDCPKERVWFRRMGPCLAHLFPTLPCRAQYNKRIRALRPRLAGALSLLAQVHPGAFSQLLIVDTTPVPTGTSITTKEHSQLRGYADTGWCASFSRWYWGFKLVLIASPDGFPVAFELVTASVCEQDALRAVLHQVDLDGRTILGDKGFYGKELEAEVAAVGARLVRPDRIDEKPRFGKYGRYRQWIESINQTLKGQLSLERHGGRTLDGLVSRVFQRLLALATAVWLNAKTGNPGRSLVAYDH
jgi:hypothetical protein